MKCGHFLCDNCATKIRQIRPFCPLCRAWIGPEEEEAAAEAGGGSGSTSPLPDSEPPLKKPRPQTPTETEWNVGIARVQVKWSTPSKGGVRTLMMRDSDGSPVATGITSVGAPRITIQGNPNIIINGRQVENAQECASQ